MQLSQRSYQADISPLFLVSGNSGSFKAVLSWSQEGLLGITAEKRDIKYCESLVKGKGGEGVERSNMGS